MILMCRRSLVSLDYYITVGLTQIDKMMRSSTSHDTGLVQCIDQNISVMFVTGCQLSAELLPNSTHLCSRDFYHVVYRCCKQSWNRFFGIDFTKQLSVMCRQHLTYCIYQSGHTMALKCLTISGDKLPHSGWNSSTSLHKLDLGDDDVVLQNRATAGAHSAASRLVHIDVWPPTCPAHPRTHDGQRNLEISCWQDHRAVDTLNISYFCWIEWYECLSTCSSCCGCVSICSSGHWTALSFHHKPDLPLKIM